MRSHATLCNCLFASSNSLEHSHALLHEQIALYVNEVGAGQAMLSDENGLLVALDVREEFGGLPFESGDKFGAHEVILKYHFMTHKCSTKRLASEFTGLRGFSRRSGGTMGQ